MHYAIVEDRKEDQDYLAGLIRAEHAKAESLQNFRFMKAAKLSFWISSPECFRRSFWISCWIKTDSTALRPPRRLRLLAERTPIIFTTSELDFALEGYEVHPLDYLLNRLQMKLPFISMNRAMS